MNNDKNKLIGALAAARESYGRETTLSDLPRAEREQNTMTTPLTPPYAAAGPDLLGPNGRVIAVCLGYETDAQKNARKLAQALNSHDELLTALRDIIGTDCNPYDVCPYCGRDNRESAGECTSDDCPLVRARAAIAKAEAAQ